MKRANWEWRGPLKPHIFEYLVSSLERIKRYGHAGGGTSLELKLYAKAYNLNYLVMKVKLQNGLYTINLYSRKKKYRYKERQEYVTNLTVAKPGLLRIGVKIEVFSSKNNSQWLLP